jgi:hypothetical protein
VRCAGSKKITAQGEDLQQEQLELQANPTCEFKDLIKEACEVRETSSPYCMDDKHLANCSPQGKCEKEACPKSCRFGACIPCSLPQATCDGKTRIYCTADGQQLQEECAETCQNGLCFGTPSNGCGDKKKYYADQDQDGYGDPTNSIQSCPPPPANFVENKSDCDDRDNKVHPGQSEYFETSSNGQGIFDYNCDGVEEVQYKDVVSCQLLTTLTCITPGWKEKVPTCGAQAPYIPSCAGLGPCHNNPVDRRQTCR